MSGTYRTMLPDGREFAVESSDLAEFARNIGLDRIAKGRYSPLFAFKLLLYTTFEGIEAPFILEELKALEGQPNEALPTKPATAFTRAPLLGLWHKHFFSSRFVAHNIAVHMNHKRLTETINRIFDPVRSPRITAAMIGELSRAVVSDSLQEREDSGKLTGEWIVFARHQGENYYLTLTPHPNDGAAGDQRIYDDIQKMAAPHFPFLRSLDQ